MSGLIKCCYEFLTLGFTEEEMRRLEEEEMNSLFSSIESHANIHQISYKEHEPQNLENFVVHKIENEDTLEGLCLKYDVSVGQIKEANAFTGNTLEDFFEKEILIPKIENKESEKIKRDTQEKNYLLEKFSKGKHISKEMAKKFLSKNEWNLKKADESFNNEFNKQYKNLE
eukprot:gene10586-3104_t